jgi:hypothetical protein
MTGGPTLVLLLVGFQQPQDRFFGVMVIGARLLFGHFQGDLKSLEGLLGACRERLVAARFLRLHVCTQVGQRDLELCRARSRKESTRRVSLWLPQRKVCTVLEKRRTADAAG